MSTHLDNICFMIDVHNTVMVAETHLSFFKYFSEGYCHYCWHTHTHIDACDVDIASYS
jgi:hypothetical protein